MISLRVGISGKKKILIVGSHYGALYAKRAKIDKKMGQRFNSAFDVN